MTARCCRTCYWWSNVHPPLATGTRFPAGADPEIGTCHVDPPVLIRAPVPVSMYPATHADRHCAQWQPADGPEGGGGEEIGTGHILPFPLREVA